MILIHLFRFLSSLHSQVLSDRLYEVNHTHRAGTDGGSQPDISSSPAIVAVDLQPMAPIDGVLCMQVKQPF